MVAMKRKIPGQEYNEDDKLKHQATKALTKEAKRVKTFLLQQAIRKSKAAAEKKGLKAAKKAAERDGPPKAPSGDAAITTATTSIAKAGSAVCAEVHRGEDEEHKEEEHKEEEQEGEATPSSVDDDASGGVVASSQDVLLIKSLQPLAVVKICLRRLGLAHTGVEGEAEVEVGGSDQLRRLVGQVVGHKRITAVLEELQDRVTLRRREKLAESEGRSLPGQGQGRAARSKGKAKKAAAAESHWQQVGGGGKTRSDSSRRAPPAAAGSVGSAFVSLSGESPGDEEPSRNYYNKDIANANASPRPKRWKPDPPAAGKTSKTSTTSSRVNSSVGDRASSEPGWAGADRAAGWGRGGGRSKNGGRGGRGGRGAGGRLADNNNSNSNDPSRQQEGRGGGAGRGRGSGARAGGAGGGGGGGNSNREDSRGGSIGGEALHGSWAAKRALKEKEASATSAFSGKRTTFGDDDD